MSDGLNDKQREALSGFFERGVSTQKAVDRAVSAAVHIPARKPVVTFHLSMAEIECIVAAHLQIDPDTLICAHELRDGQQYVAAVIHT